MLLSALTLAAMLQAAPGGVRVLRDPTTADAAREASEREGRRRPFTTRSWPRAQPAKFLRSPVPCRKNGLERAGHPEALKAKPLGELPMAYVEYAISRTVDGCPVSVLVAQDGPAR